MKAPKEKSMLAAMRKPLSLFALSFGAMLLIGFAPSVAKADQVGFCTDVTGQSGLGACSKTVRIVGNVVTITLTNTTSAAIGGFITADAFNFTAGTQVVANSFTTTNSNFSFTQGVTSASPFPDRNALISTGGAFTGGGTPSLGIGVGQTATFTFTLVSPNGNTELSILTSEAIRFRGFANDGSDKSLVAPVPEPATMILLGTGLAGIAAKLRRRRKSGQDSESSELV